MLAQLKEGLRAMGQAPESHPCDSYLAYLALLEKWNRAYNLTGIKNMEDMLGRHLFDSLSALEHVRGRRALDVGSGAGLPGLVLAMARPKVNWVLLDSNIKKTRFLEQAVMELGLINVEVVHLRLEDYEGEKPFDTIISRALMSAEKFSRQCLPLLAEGGRILLMKGTKLDEELAGLKDSDLRVSSTEVAVPGVAGVRHILQIE